MSYIDSFIIFLYLIFTIIIGILAGKDVKSTKDFAVGNKDFLTLTLVMTIFATYVDGEAIINGTTQAFKSGLSFFFVLLGGAISLFLYGYIAIKVANYKNAISVGDIVGSMYGVNSQITTGISGFLISTALVATQFKALSFVFGYFYGLENNLGIWVSSLILIAYSTFGGVKAVSWTDVIQFLILIIAVPLVTSVALNNAGGIVHLFKSLPPEKLTFFASDKETFYKYIVYFIAIIIPLCSPAMVQRMLMSRSSKQSKTSYRISAIIIVPFMFIITIAGMSAYLIDPNIDGNNAYIYLIDKYMPVGLKGFTVAGMIAIIMSTADSFMNTAAICFSHDVLGNILKTKLKDEMELKLTKIVTFAIGVLACLIAIRYESILDLMLYSYSLWGPVVTIPFIFGIYGFIGPKYGFYLSMVAGITTSLVWALLDLEKQTYIDSLIPALAANFSVFVICLLIDRKNNLVKK